MTLGDHLCAQQDATSSIMDTIQHFFHFSFTARGIAVNACYRKPRKMFL